ncbi:MAG: CoA-binding protein [Actinomycetes bacterium]
MDPELRAILLDIYARASTIAVVGASFDSRKAAHRIPLYLTQQGFTVIPVNPRGGTLFGVPVFASLAEVQQPIDVVNVFRPAPQTPPIAQAAVEAGAWCLWLQLGIESKEAQGIAEAGGLITVMNECIGADYAELGLGPPLH